MCGCQDELIRIKHLSYDHKAKKIELSDYGTCIGAKSSVESLDVNPLNAQLIAAGEFDG